MYSRRTSPHVRRLFVSIPQRFLQGVHLSPLGFAACQSKKCTIQARATPTKQELRHPSKSYFNIPRLVHLRQVHPLKAPSAVRYNIFITYESKA